jgi:hypothetical protein
MFRHFLNDPVHGHLHDPRSFTQAVEEELSGKDIPLVHRYLARGHYAEQLQHYFNLFGRDALLVLRYTDLRNDPQGVLDSVCVHARLRPHTFDEAVLRTRDNVRTYQEPMDPALAERLYAYFAPHAEALQQLLGPGWVLDERKPSPRA